MAENLNIGEAIPAPGGATNDSIIEKTHKSGDPEIYFNQYGGLYSWNEMMYYQDGNNNNPSGVQGICPTGWHVPSLSEWQELITFVGYESSGGKLKETGFDHWIEPNTGATNEHSFTALPGGVISYHSLMVTSTHIGHTASFWTATNTTYGSAYSFFMENDHADIIHHPMDQINWANVRCIMDTVISPEVYSLSLQVNPENAGNVLGAGDYEANEEVYITAQANPGWEFVNWTDANGVVSDEANFTYTMPAEDVTLTANFTEEQTGFTCGDILTDPRDGQQYETVQIDDQCWMAVNLNIGERIDGNQNMSDNGALEKYCYDDDPANCGTYGGLYQWDEMMQYITQEGVQGICPEGWHVPSDAEWAHLTDYVVSQGYPNVWDNPNGSGNALKSCRQVNSPLGGACNINEHPRWNEHNTHHGIDIFGFSAVPGGYRHSSGSFSSHGNFGNWWSSSERYSTNAWRRYMYYSKGNIPQGNGDKTWGFSVRCLKNEPTSNLPPTTPENPVPADGVENQSTVPLLQWSCSDPDEDPITYDVYFGTEETPSQVATGITDNFWQTEFLEYNTQYFWKIIAHDDHDNTTQGPGWSFTTEEDSAGFICGISTITDIDGNVYNTTLIGDQCWMAENLNSTRDAAGNNITRYCYDNNPARCEQYGGLYDWNTLMNGEGSSNSNPSGIQGICPEGWHVPSDAEWTQLTDYVVSQGYPNSPYDPNGAGNALKSCRQVNSPLGGPCNTGEHPRWNEHSTHHGFDAVGFGAFPGGISIVSGAVGELGRMGYWWTCTQSTLTTSWLIQTEDCFAHLNTWDDNKSFKISVRCLKD
jgi:uncharacterized protein (TIGR02145 family)/uncharacterized repeat protein (TIGR02543 family)